MTPRSVDLLYSAGKHLWSHSSRGRTGGKADICGICRSQCAWKHNMRFTRQLKTYTRGRYLWWGFVRTIAQSFIWLCKAIYNHLYLYSKCIFPIIYLSCCSNLGSCIWQSFACHFGINACFRQSFLSANHETSSNSSSMAQNWQHSQMNMCEYILHSFHALLKKKILQIENSTNF